MSQHEIDAIFARLVDERRDPPKVIELGDGKPQPSLPEGDEPILEVDEADLVEGG